MLPSVSALTRHVPHLSPRDRRGGPPVWTKPILLTCALLILGLLLPRGVSASHVTVFGSLTITKQGGGVLTTELVGLALIANPGLEKNITIQIPPFSFPVLVGGETEDAPEATSSSKLLTKNIDTTLVLTNTTSGTLSLTLTLRDAGGHVLSTTNPPSLAANASTVIMVSDLLP